MQFQNATQAVSVALQAIFERWTALRLVTEHQFGGAPYEANQLLESTIAMATDPAKRYSNDDYISMFYTLFERVNTDIEDGSPEEVAALILKVRDAAAVGNFIPAKEIAEKAGISARALEASVQANQDDADNVEFVPRAGPRTRSQTRAQPVVDEDGFTQVQTKRRNR